MEKPELVLKRFAEPGLAGSIGSVVIVWFGVLFSQTSINKGKCSALLVIKERSSLVHCCGGAWGHQLPWSTAVETPLNS